MNQVDNVRQRPSPQSNYLLQVYYILLCHSYKRIWCFGHCYWSNTNQCDDMLLMWHYFCCQRVFCFHLFCSVFLAKPPFYYSELSAYVPVHFYAYSNCSEIYLFWLVCPHVHLLILNHFQRKEEAKETEGADKSRKVDRHFKQDGTQDIVYT